MDSYGQFHFPDGETELAGAKMTPLKFLLVESKSTYYSSLNCPPKPTLRPHRRLILPGARVRGRSARLSLGDRIQPGLCCVTPGQPLSVSELLIYQQSNESGKVRGVTVSILSHQNKSKDKKTNPLYFTLAKNIESRPSAPILILPTISLTLDKNIDASDF